MARIARREMRTQIEALKKSNSKNRAEIAFLKKRADLLEREVKLLINTLPRKSSDLLDRSEHVQRFSPKGLASHRQRLGLSAVDAGLLLGTSGQSIYNGEAGTSRPRAQHFEAPAAFRKMGKRAVDERSIDQFSTSKQRRTIHRGMRTAV